jgi:hypothetical protein
MENLETMERPSSQPKNKENIKMHSMENPAQSLETVGNKKVRLYANILRKNFSF